MLLHYATNKPLERLIRSYRPENMNGCVLYLPFWRYGAESPKIWDNSGNNYSGTIAGAVPAISSIYTPVVASGSCTLANMRLSAVNGTAFTDFSVADVLTDHIGKYLIVRDSTGKQISGFIKAAGTGETLVDVVSGWDLTSGWGVDNATINDANTFTLTSNNGYVQKTLTINVGRLYKITFDSTQTLGTTVLADGTEVMASDGDIDKYFVATASASLRVRNSLNTAVVDINTMIVNRVNTPAATGVTIVSTQGGTTYNWASQESGFNYNDASGYTYEIREGVSRYEGLGWGFDGVDDRIVHSSLNLGKTHTLHYWLRYIGVGIIHSGAANYHGLRLTWTQAGYNAGTTEVLVTHGGLSSYQGKALFSIVRSGTSVSFYQNGVQIGATQTLLANNDLTVTDIGRSAGGTNNYFSGVVYEAVAFNRAMSALEVRNYFEVSRNRYL